MAEGEGEADLKRGDKRSDTVHTQGRQYVACGVFFHGGPPKSLFSLKEGPFNSQVIRFSVLKLKEVKKKEGPALLVKH